jgi:hypothetical protein
MSFEFVVCIGGPGSGKSTIFNIMFSSTHTLLDSDIVKKEHEQYDTLVQCEEGIEELHLWARPRLAQLMDKEIAACDQNLIYLTTGRNIAKVSSYITNAYHNGFRIRLVDVHCKLETSLNQNRTRPRALSDSLVKERYQEYLLAVEHCKSLVEKDCNGYCERFHPSTLGSLVGGNAEKLAETCKGLRKNAVEYVGVERNVYLDIKINAITEVTLCSEETFC